MQNAITTLRIQNFKSIKDVTMEPRRVNLIVGLPNVGKSNILEAMSLLGGMAYEQTNKFMGSFIRYEEPRQLFYNNLIANTISIVTERERVVFGVKPYDTRLVYLNIDSDTQDEFFAKSKLPHIETSERVERSLMANFFEASKGFGFDYSEQAQFIYSELSKSGGYSVPGSPKSVAISHTHRSVWPVKSYVFAKATTNHEYGHTFLQPPHGDNLLDVVQSFPGLRREMASLFTAYDQKLLVRMDERRFEVVREMDGIIYSHPYSSIADTLQRIIFYLAAIESNKDSVLLFEEPEAHSFPAYVTMLGQRMVESTDNQFFVATHSPYLMTQIVEQMLPEEGKPSELAIFVAYYEDYQTKVKQLSDEEVREIRNDSIDVFYNLSRFTPGSNLYA